MDTIQTTANTLRLFPRGAVTNAVIWAAMRVADWRRLRGVRVGVVNPPGMDEEVCYERIERSIALIDMITPYWSGRLRRDISGILCFGTGRNPVLGGYMAIYRICILDPRHVLDPRARPVDVASTIVHEAKHARFHRRGIRRSQLGNVRIEAACARAERDFRSKYDRLLKSEGYSPDDL